MLKCKSLHIIMLSLLAMSVLACLGSERESGESCDDGDACQDGFSCITFEQGSDSGFCLEDCALADGTLCADGSVCSEVTSERGACNQIGGDKNVGQRCEVTSDCEVGAICLEDIDEQVAGYCWKACDQDDALSCPSHQSCKAYGVNELSVCQDDLLGVCDVDLPMSTCEEGLTCGIETTDAQELFAFVSRCNKPDCVTDADCPSRSVCRDFHGAYDADTGVFTPADASTRRFCYATCKGQDTCGVLPIYTCVTPEQCTDDSGECASLTRDESVCVPSF